MARTIVLIALVAACGRLDFDTNGFGPCSGSPSTAPDPLTIAGNTFEFTSPNDTTKPTAGVVVTATARADGMQLGQTVSDQQGDYNFPISTGGVPRNIVLTYAPPGYLTSTAVYDGPFDHDEINPSNLITDNPVWSDGSIDSVYSVTMPHIARSQAAGSLNIGVHDCAGNNIEGVTVAVDPAPALLAYVGPGGTLVQSGTVDPYTYAVAFNAQPGPTRISARHDGMIFLDQNIDVLGGENVTLVFVRPIE